jgi:perosamine synthetase
MITTHLSPATSKMTALECVKIILTPWKNQNSVLTELEGYLSIGAQLPYLNLYSSGRSALYHLLKSQITSSTDEVIMQSFSCSVVPASVLEAGAIPVFVDIDKNTLNISPQSLKERITKRTKVVIFQHTFGNSSGLHEIKKICSDKKIFLIEDRAHIFDNRPLLGNAAVFSFGRSKWVSSIFGGALGLKDKSLLAKIKREAKLEYPSQIWVFKQLLYPIWIELLVKPFLGKIKIGEIFLLLLSRLNILSKEVSDVEKKGRLGYLMNKKLSPALGRLLIFEIGKLNYLRERREKVTNIYKDNLPTSNQFEEINGIGGLLYFPLHVDDPQSIYEYSKKQGFSPGNWYFPAISPPGTQNASIRYKPDTCPEAENISEHIINLPTLVNDETAFRICSILESYFNNDA